jgi:prepilin-type N-terminal cleavage/methylation domain-containing protein
MTRSRGVAGGLTMIEVLVALALLSINALAISGLWMLALDLTRRVETITHILEEGVTLPACAVMVTLPFRRAQRQRRARRAAFTVVEILVALALGGIVMTLAFSFWIGGLRTSAALTARALDQETRMAIPAILNDLVATAGAGVGAPDCGLGVSADGRTLVLTRSEPDGTLRVDEMFSGFDGGGRPALYLRHRPYARQPWLEEVTAFEIVSVRESLDGRLDAVELRVVHSGASRPIAVVVPLPHRPCLADGS